MFKNIEIFFYCWLSMDFIVVLSFHYDVYHDVYILLTPYTCN